MADMQNGAAVNGADTEELYNPGADPELRRQIEEALDTIRPYLMADGGSVRLLPDEHYDAPGRNRAGAQAERPADLPRGGRQCALALLSHGRGQADGFPGRGAAMTLRPFLLYTVPPSSPAGITPEFTRRGRSRT